MATAQKVLAYAESFAGYVEGPRANETIFGAWAGAQFQAWCHSFVSYCLDHEGESIGKITYCPAGVTYFRDRGRLYTTPKVGDLFYLWFPSKNRYAHTGFVKAVDGDYIITREGNSNAAGSRTGGAVVTLRRQWSGTRTVFGRPAYDAPAPTPTPSPVEEDMNTIIPSWASPLNGRWPHFRLLPPSSDTTALVLAYPGVPFQKGLDAIPAPKFTYGTGLGGIPMVTISGLPARASGIAEAPNGAIIVTCANGATFQVAQRP